MRLDADGAVCVSLPYWLPYKTGEEFARAKSGWIERQRAQTPAVILQHGQAIGKAHRLYFEPQTQAARVTTRLRQNEIRIHHPAAAAWHAPDVQQAARQASLRALRREAEALLPQRLDTLARQAGFSFNSVRVRPLKSRWGSCTSARDITLNIFLMQLPWHLIDYVLLHELTHTRVMQHGAPFWQELEQHMPGAKHRRSEINTYQPVLSPRP